MLFDECVPRALKEHLPGHNCTTVPEAGLAGTENGKLLWAAEQARFDVFLTVDRGLQYQQNLEGRKIAVVIPRARRNSLPRLLPLLPDLLSRLQGIERGDLIVVDKPT